MPTSRWRALQRTTDTLNPPETYFNAGRSAAQALNRGDSSLAEHWRTWRIRAIRLETPEDALEAERLYDEGYRSARRVPRVEHFR